jgi:hypothetical protein
MAFDPDAYLAKKQPSTSFDPDAYLQSKVAEKPSEPDTEGSSDFVRGIRNYLPGLQETYGGAKVFAGLAAKKLGATDTAKSLIEGGIETMDVGQSKQVTRDTDTFTNAWEKGIGSVVTDWLPYQMGAGVANIAETLAMMGIGAGVGAVTGAGVGALPGAVAGAVSKTLVKQGVKEAAEKVAKEQGEEAAQRYVQAEAKKAIVRMGSTAGMVGQAGLHGTGEVTGRAAEEAKRRGERPEDIEMSRVLPAAIAHGVADFFINKIGLNSLKIGETGTKYLAADIAKRIGVTGVKEIPAEEIQTMAERYGAKLSLTDAEAVKEYVDTAAAAFGMSVVPGGIGGARTHLSNKFSNLAKQEQEQGQEQEKATTETATKQIAAPSETVDPELQAALSLDTKYFKPIPPPTDTAAQGEQNVAGTNQPPVGTSTSVAEQPNTNAAPTPSEEAQLDGVVSTGETTGQPPVGEGQQPSALENLQPSPFKLTRGEVTPEAVSKLSDEQLSAELNNIYLNDPENALVQAELTKRQQGTPSGTTTPKAVQAETQGQKAAAKPAAPAAEPAGSITPKKISDLSPELQEEVARRRDQIAEIESDGGDASKQKKFLNAFLANQGITGTLPARRETKSIEKDFLEEGELPYAVAGKEKSDSAQEIERVQAYKESLTDEKGKPRVIPDYEISNEDQRLYNEVRDEVNTETKAANERRLKLVAERDAANKELKAAQNAFDEATDEQETPAYTRLEAALKRFNQAEKALEAHGEERLELPEYSKKFAADYKDVYFGNITAGVDLDPKTNKMKMAFASGKNEHRKAAKALQAYMREMRGRDKEQMSPQERRIANAYNEMRVSYSKIFPVSFPRWQDLTAEQKDVFRSNIVSLAGAQQDVAFAFLGKKLVEDSKLSEGEKREKQNVIDRQNEVRSKSEAQQEKDRKTRESYERNKPSYSSLPNNVVKMVSEGNLQGVLQHMRSIPTTALTNPYKRIMKAVAQSLFEMKLNTKIKIVDSSEIDGDLAQYKPENDTIYVSKEGLSSNTLLHEIIHAGTVKVINEYLNGNKKSLSAEQLRGVQQLERIMNDTRETLGEDHPEAYKNLFEFVAYALTSDQLQQDLHDEQAISSVVGAMNKLPTKEGYATTEEENIGTILPEEKSQWSAFKLAIARILKVRDVYLRKSGVANKNIEANYVMEIAAAFEDMLAKPTQPIYLPALPTKKAPKKAEAASRDVNSLDEDDESYDPKEDQMPKGWKYWKRKLNTIDGWQEIARDFQNDRYHIKEWERALDLAGEIYREGQDKINNIYEQIVRSTGIARNYFNRSIADPSMELNLAVSDFAKALGVKTDQALNKLHRVLEALHEPERRMIKFILNVPLSTSKTLSGGTVSPAEARSQIVKLLDAKKMTKTQAKDLRAKLDAIIFKQDKNGDIVYKDGVPQLSKNVDPLGSSPAGHTGAQSIDFRNESLYSATGMSPDSVKSITAEYGKHPNKKEIDRVLAAIKTLTDRTADLNRLSNYWSFPVDNRVNFYGWDYYVPLKGTSRDGDAQLDFSKMGSGKNGRQFQEAPASMEGRYSVSTNPVLQVMSDATRSAMRAGLKDVTQSVKNALNQKLIPGKVLRHITFEERKDIDPAEFKGETTLFHYNEDGSIDVLQISDPKLLNSVRRTFKKATPLTDIANTITSTIGKMHTRYNYQFAPMNFARDMLTNAFTIGAELGPAKAARFLGDVATMVVAKNGLYKAMQVAILYEKGDAKSQGALRQLAKTDPYLSSMVEFIEEGGMVSYLQGMSIKSNFQELHKDIGRSGIMHKKEQLEKFIDTWTDMFEIASRAAAYKIAKETALSKGESEKAAKVRASAYAKNLANFEQVGEYGKALGAAYMFFRPAATGAVRAIEAVVPAFPGSLDRAMERLSPSLSDKARETFKKNYKEKTDNSRIMLASLTGLGVVAYMMALMMSDDDDLGRNAVATDNMQQWTRFARFHIPKAITESMGIKEPVVFQLPWGFGLGAFMASGAQIAAYGAGKQSFGDMAANIFTQISLDSFIPIPVSRMPPGEMPLEFVLDSVAPSAARPILEFALNKNGLGQKIYNDQNRKFGDAYTGGDKIPQIYKDAAIYLADTSIGSFLGEVDVSPNTLYFLSNSYIDGIARVADGMYGIVDATDSRPPFNPKTDLPLLGSFFGARSNVDSREFSKVENQIKAIERQIKMYDTKPEKAVEYDTAHPMNRPAVELYNKMVNGELRDLRQEANTIRRDQTMPADVKRELITVLTLQQNIIKRQMIDMFDAYEIKP